MHQHQQTFQQTQNLRLNKTEPLLHQQLLVQVMSFQFLVGRKVELPLEFLHQLLGTWLARPENL